jgi:hypothetical protein
MAAKVAGEAPVSRTGRKIVGISPDQDSAAFV